MSYLKTTNMTTPTEQELREEFDKEFGRSDDPVLCEKDIDHPWTTEVIASWWLSKLQERDRKGKPLYNFGDIFTNGINYWMVINPSSDGEPLRPVVLNKDKTRVMYFVGYYTGGVSSIKPYAKFVGNVHSLLSREERKEV